MRVFGFGAQESDFRCGDGGVDEVIADAQAFCGIAILGIGAKEEDAAEKLSVFLAIKNQIKVDSWIKQEIDKNERRETQWKEGRSGITG